MYEKQMITPLLGGDLRMAFNKISKEDFHTIQEVRIRANKPVLVNSMGSFKYLSSHGYFVLEKDQAITVDEQLLQETLELISDYSLYAFEEELRSGYITVKGGHRIGVVGKTILSDGQVRTIRYISGINIRIAHEVKGCADEIMPLIMHDDKINHTLIVSPPGKGKTTLLRDIIRQLADVPGINVGVVDERSEIAGCYRGIPQLDVGLQADILDGCPKAEGMMMLLRAMGPRIIAVDEIGSAEDIRAIETIVNAGVHLICTVHGDSYEDITGKPILGELIKKKIFNRLIFLSKGEETGKITSILNAKGLEIYKKVGKYYAY